MLSFWAQRRISRHFLSHYQITTIAMYTKN